MAAFLLRKPRDVCFVGLPGRHGDGYEEAVTESHRHDYTRPPAFLSDAVGGLSTPLGPFASPLWILSTESVLMMEWKGMSTSRAGTSTASSTGRAARVAINVRLPYHSIIRTDSVGSIHGGLAKGPSEMLNPPTSLPMHVVLPPSIAVRMRLCMHGVSRQSTRHAVFGVEAGP